MRVCLYILDNLSISVKKLKCLHAQRVYVNTTVDDIPVYCTQSVTNIIITHAQETAAQPVFSVRIPFAVWRTVI